ncbi:MAG: ParB/RepB/Spo0J family partition protein, partial [Dehalococcoidia bacterium]|nr:ParB/RepB/Spo0J family partition protein [Dehalococcoidia bacterium]
LDLDPISEARFYKRYLEEFHVTQTDLAERVGCSQSEIANSLRLLELPAQVQGKLIAREITAHHGRVLLTAAKQPEVQQAAIAALEKDQLSVRALIKVVDDGLRATEAEKPSELSEATAVSPVARERGGLQPIKETDKRPDTKTPSELESVAALLDKAVDKADPQSPALVLFEIEVMLGFSRDMPKIDDWFRQRTALGRAKYNEVEDRLDHFMRHKTYDELRRLAGRLALQIMSLKLRDDQLKHYLKLLEKEPA